MIPDARDEGVARDVELVVAERRVVEACRIEGLHHLGAVVVAAEQARPEEVAGQHEQHRALGRDPLLQRREPCQAAVAVGQRVRHVHVVDGQEARLAGPGLQAPQKALKAR
jgi:hypothetical protein